MDSTSLGIQILENCRNELFSLFPHLDGAFSCLSYAPDPAMDRVETEGERLAFSPAFLIRRYGQCPAAVRRGYLHLLLHCLLLHPFWTPPEDLRRWDLACDLAAEQVIEREARPELVLPPDPVRTQCFQLMGTQALSAQTIYSWLEQGRFPFPAAELEAAFRFDSHTRWAGRRAAAVTAGTRRKWEGALSYTNGCRRGSSAGSQGGSGTEVLSPVPARQYDYSRFLRRFAVPREEVELDTESFDYVLYHFGLERYGNLPLIEPLEYREVHRLEELVIAIDTSGSCSRETVQRFLAETYRILSEKENFFRKMKVYLIQCDCLVQSVAVIRSQEEWRQRSQEITIQGRGGTDFTPVFRYVEQLRAKKALCGPRALLYFTDGDGVYPRTKPDYETAFVFLRKPAQVPAWAIPLILEENPSCKRQAHI